MLSIDKIREAAQTVENRSLLFLFLITILYVFSKGSIMERDTGSYLHLTIITTPVYPLFLYGFKKIFGIDGLGPYVLTVQLIYGLYAIWFFIHKIKFHYQCRAYLTIGFSVILLVPFWDPGILVANRIVSEALAYPTFLIWLGIGLSLLHTYQGRKLFYFFTVLFILISLRPQFFFILPVLVISLLYALSIRIAKKKIIYTSLLIVLLLPVALKLFEKSYHYAMRGEFVSTANTGVQIMAMPFFVADQGDFDIYKEPLKQNYFKYVYQKADSARVLQNYYKASFDDTSYHHLHKNYADLSFGILSKKGRFFLGKEDSESQRILIKNNDLLIAMWLPLVLDNFLKFTRIFFQNLLNAFDGYILFFLHVLLLLYYTSQVVIHRKRNTKDSFMLILFLLLFSNAVLVCLVEHSIDRYFIYTRWILAFAIITFIQQVVQKETTSK
ncbi:hypothetical protein NBT05_01360 [Aquimarina sp. ERC-38]|uniref:hypothetical protein n=1 Tax=Aquimarina sp. ERC-38 TaxID=2949996 RepID=UPI002246B374|nr:hypothetical protein [Aquimarina sp. ERC-38]UZO81140.1 hypothetical protein NBT05_01360 [Aquimarina sp. ERC-38]